MSEQAADALENAADHLEEFGWIFGVLIDDDGHTCALGALREGNKISQEAGSLQEWPDYVQEAILALGQSVVHDIKKVYPNWHATDDRIASVDQNATNITTWNDSVVGSHYPDNPQPVLDRLRKVAKEIRDE